jgi:D-glycero-alpha-D-manno-heptose-7-phosphate kinase
VLIQTKAPLRISYVGGGTDYKEYFANNTGCVIGTSINWYSYVSVLKLSNLADEKIRLTYRITESVKEITEIKHPIFRAALQESGIKDPLNVATFADIPAGTGLGSSSAFTVALVSALNQYKGIKFQQKKVAEDAIRIEREILSEPGGHQDQLISTYGGCRSYTFYKDETTISGPLLSVEQARYISDRQFLIYTGNARFDASHAEAAVVTAKNPDKARILMELSDIALELKSELESIAVSGKSSILAYERIKHAVEEGWKLKCTLQPDILEREVGRIGQELQKLSVRSFKLLGSGGGGFVLALAEPDEIEFFKRLNPEMRIFQPQISLTGVVGTRF